MGQELNALAIPADLEPLFPARVMGGTRPWGGGMHLGHYFGTVQQCARLQYEYPGDAFCVIADYHTLTSERQPESLADSARTFALDYLALGIDPNLCTLYQQSDVPQVCELMWILGCVSRKARFDRAQAYRAAVHEGQAVSLGLFLYPALLAADVLALRATDVPLAEDQGPTLEIVREVARAFNQRWRTVFPLPCLRQPVAATLRGIDGRKMSESYGNELPVFWTDEQDFEARVMRMVTGSASLGEPIDPDSCSVFALYRLVADAQMTAEMRDGFERGRLGYRDAKRMLLAALRSYFEPFHERRRALQADGSIVDDVLQSSARRAREEAEATLDVVRSAASSMRLASR